MKKLILIYGLFLNSVSSETSVKCVVNDDYELYSVKALKNNIKETCPLNTTSVDIQGEVRTISKSFFQDVETLQWVTMNNVKLDEIQLGSFGNIPKVKTLVFDNNNLKGVKRGVFQNLNVETISLENNSVSFIESGAFKNLPNLRILGLGNNRLNQVKKEMFENITLQDFIVAGNNLSNFEKGFFEKFHIPENGYGLVLYLQENNLEEIDPEVFKNTQIRELLLSDNKISVLRPGDLANAPNVDTINLSNNKLKQIPEGVFSGTKIYHLDLSNNQISTISKGAFNNMLSLQVIKLDHNQLKIWDSDWFHGSPVVKNLVFSYNNLEEIPAEAFKNIPNCNFMYFEGNKIETVYGTSFKGLAKLSDLDLKGNKLRGWNKNLLEAVRYLDLSGNPMGCPKEGAKSVAPMAVKVTIDNCS